jgi:hypothetical protein
VIFIGVVLIAVTLSVAFVFIIQFDPRKARSTGPITGTLGASLVLAAAAGVAGVGILGYQTLGLIGQQKLADRTAYRSQVAAAKDEVALRETIVNQLVKQQSTLRQLEETLRNENLARDQIQAGSGSSNAEEFDLLENYYGYYGDLRGTKTEVRSEQVKLQFSKSSPKVVGLVSADAVENDKQDTQTWKAEGFHRGIELVLSFFAVPRKDDTSIARVIGGYFLQYGKDENGVPEYTGTAIFNDCKQRVVVQCPYAMTQKNIGEAKSHWPALFKRECDVLKLRPDDPGNIHVC